MRSITSLMAFVFVVGASSSAWASPRIFIDEDRVWVEGINPNGGAAWLSVERERDTWRTHVIVRQGVVEASDARGRADLLLDEDVEEHSVWAVVDLVSGQLAVAVPDGRPSREVPAPSQARNAEGDYRMDILESHFRYAELIVVRPGRGAWMVEAGDGGVNDNDGQANGVISLRPYSMRSLGDDGQAFDKLHPGDVVVSIHPQTLEFYVQRITGAETD